MQKRAILTMSLAVLALSAAPVLAGHVTHKPHKHIFDRHIHVGQRDGFRTDWDGDTLVLTDQDDTESVEMTPAGEIAVNGRSVSLDRGQRRLVQDFYGQYVQIEEEAAALGKEAAKVGADGAALGVEALRAALIRLESGDYDDESDDEDSEQVVKASTDRIEAKAAVLEKRGEAIEALVDDMGETVDQLRARVPELGKLDWFVMNRDDSGDDE